MKKNKDGKTPMSIIKHDKELKKKVVKHLKYETETDKNKE